MRQLSKNFFSGLVLLALCACCLASGYPETINLKSGKCISGNITSKEKDCIKVDVGGVVMTYFLDDIASIDDAGGAGKKQKTTVYKVTKTFTLKVLSDVYTLQFGIPLPRKDIENQTISEAKVFPNSNVYLSDPGGNDVAVFYFSNVKAGKQIIAGTSYTVAIADLPEVKADAVSADYGQVAGSLAKYLESEKNMHIKSPAIEAMVTKEITEIKNPYIKAKTFYDYIVKNIAYDHDLFIKFLQGYDVTHGEQSPEETLAKKKGICIDIARLFVVLARASGVPARIVCGIVFSPGHEGAKKDVTKFGHAWAEIYLPGYGWVAVDPTFGISEKEKFYAFPYRLHLRESYGEIDLQQFGSLTKGWGVMVRVLNKPSRYPVDIDMTVELENMTADPAAAPEKAKVN